MRAPWIADDFGAIARTIGLPKAGGFVDRMEVEPGALVLDIACGTGNVTIPFARRGANVTGLDMTPHLLEEARARAAGEGLRIRFDEGFAERLPCPDASFDIVASMFGIMFSPFPEVVTSEMARVLKPGGRLALANWTPSGFSGKMAAAVGRHLPLAPPGAMSPHPLGRRSGRAEQAEAVARRCRNRRCPRHMGHFRDRSRRSRILHGERRPAPTHARTPRSGLLC